MPIAICFAVALLTLGGTVARAAGEPGIARQDGARAIVSRVRPAASVTAIARTGDPGGRLVAAGARVAMAESQVAGVQRPETLHADQVQRLAQLEGRWRLAFWAIVGLSIALSVAGAVAAVARRRERGAMRYARSMAQELEEKRRSGLTERQQSARRIVELEERVRQLDAQLGDPSRSVPRSA